LDSGNTEVAVTIFQHALQDKSDERDRIVEHLISMHALQLRAADIYKIADKKDRDMIFAESVSNYTGFPPSDEARKKKMSKACADLAELRTPDARDDAWLVVLKGYESHLRGDFEKAIEAYKKALPRLPIEDRGTLVSNSMFDCFAALNRLGELYSLAPSEQLFDQLAKHYDEKKQAANLKTLIEERKKKEPSFPTLKYWNATSAWLKFDYQTALTEYQEVANDKELQNMVLLQMNCKERIVRCLIRLKKADDAIDVFNNMPEPMPWILKPMILAAVGNIDDFQKEFRRLVNVDSRRIRDMYSDEDLGPLLNQKEFDSIRKEFPKPGDIKK
jgi:tetratricopeptide (TPR) repeat protein